MSRIREAYEQFMAIIQEETGCKARISVNFHPAYNACIRTREGAARIAEVISGQLGTEFRHSTGDNSGWYSNGHVWGNEFVFHVFHDKESAPLTCYEEQLIKEALQNESC